VGCGDFWARIQVKDKEGGVNGVFDVVLGECNPVLISTSPSESGVIGTFEFEVPVHFKADITYRNIICRSEVDGGLFEEYEPINEISDQFALIVARVSLVMGFDQNPTVVSIKKPQIINPRSITVISSDSELSYS